MVNIQELVNRRNPVTVYSPTRALDRARANAGTAGRISGSRMRSGVQQQVGMQQPAAAPSFQLGQTQQMPMPQVGAPTGATGPSMVDMLARARATPAGGGGGGGGGGLLGSVVNSLPGQAIMGALNVLDVPRRAVMSTIQETADMFNGGDADWNDFVDQIGDANFGFGSIVGSTGNIWLDRTIGFIGDVALDPMTYIGGAGVIAGTGKRMRLGLAARAVEAGVDHEIAARLGRLGLAGITDAEREIVRVASERSGGWLTEGAEKILDRGFYGHLPFSDVQHRIPFTGKIDELVGGTAARIRATIADTPFARAIRNVNVDESIAQASERLLTGRGPLTLAEAAEVLNKAQAHKMGSKLARRQAEAAMAAIIKTHGVDGLNGMVKQAEEQGGTAINAFFAKMAKQLNDMGIAHGNIKNYVPHYYTDAGKEWLEKADAKAQALAKVFGAGNSLDDFNPSLLKRHFIARPDKPYDIMGFKFTLKTGSIDEINSQFKQFTGLNFNILEDDFSKIGARYMANVGDSVGHMAGIQRLLKSKSGLLRTGDDHNILKDLVDDDATRLANEAKLDEMRNQLDSLSKAVDQMRVDAATGVHAAASGVLGTRLRDVLEDMTSLTTAQRLMLNDSIDADSRLSQLRGITNYQGAKASGPGTLYDALEQVYNETSVTLRELAGERANLERAAFLQQQQLLGELANLSPSQIAAGNADKRFGELARYRKVTAQMLELQRDRAAVSSAAEIIQTAEIRAATAGRLAEDSSFLTQFLPPEARELMPNATKAERIAAEQARRRRTLESATQTRTYDRPGYSTEDIYEGANNRREALFNHEARNLEDVPLSEQYVERDVVSTLAGQRIHRGVYNPQPSTEYQRLNVEALEKQRDIEAKAAEVVKARHAIEDVASAESAKISGARQALQVQEGERSRFQLRINEIEDVPGRKEERRALSAQRREHFHGPLATAKQAYSEAQFNLNQARKELDDRTEELARLQSQQMEIAQRMDRQAFEDRRAGRRAAWGDEAPRFDYDQEQLPLTPEEHAGKRAQYRQAREAKFAYDTSSVGKVEGSLRREQAKASKDLGLIQSEMDNYNKGEVVSVFRVDNDGNLVVRDAADARDFRVALDRDTEVANAKHLEERYNVAQSDYRKVGERFDAGEITEIGRKRLETKARRQMDTAFKEWQDSVAKVSKLNAEVEKRIFGINPAVDARGRKRAIVDHDISRHKRVIARWSALRTERDRLLAEQRQLSNELNHFTRGKALTEQLDNLKRDLDGHAEVVARNAKARDVAARTAERVYRKEEMPQTFLQDQLAQISQRESDMLTRRAAFTGYKLKWDDVAEVDVEDLNIIPLTPMERLNYEEAATIIRERHAFEGGRNHPAVRKAMTTLRELRARVGENAVVEGRLQFDDLQQALDDIYAARTSWSPIKAEQPEIHEALWRSTKRKGKRGGDTSVGGRARSTKRIAKYMQRTHMPELVKRGAIPNQATAIHINEKIAHLDNLLWQYANEPSMFIQRHLEQAQADVQRWTDFMIRYKRGIDKGLEPNDQVATFIVARSLQLESDGLAEEIKRLNGKLEYKTGRLTRHQLEQAFDADEKLRSELQQAVAAGKISQDAANKRLEGADRLQLLAVRSGKGGLTNEQAEVFKHELKAIRLDAQIELDRRTIAEVDAAKKAGTATDAMLKERGYARRRLRTNIPARHDLIPPNFGPMKDTYENVVAVITKQVHELDNRIGEFNTLRNNFRDAKSIHHQAQQASMMVDNLEAQLNAYNAGQRRLSAAIKRADRDGSDVVRYQPTITEEFFMTADQAEAAIASGDIDPLLVPKLEAEIQRVRTGRQVPAPRKRTSPEGLKTAVVPHPKTGEPITAYQGLDPEAMANAQSIEEATYRRTFMRPGPSENLVKPLTPIAPRAKKYKGPKGKRLQEFAKQHGIDPRDVISSESFHTTDRAGMLVMTKAEAVAMEDANKVYLAGLKQTQENYKLEQRILNGSIHDDVATQRAVLSDQALARDPVNPVMLDPKALQAENDAIQAAADSWEPNVMVEGVAMNEWNPEGYRPMEDGSPGRQLTEAEQRQIATNRERIKTWEKYGGKMTDEQYAAEQAKLTDWDKRIAHYRTLMGDNYDLMQAGIDGGDRFFSDLMNGRRVPTTRDMAVLRSLMGAEQGEMAGMIVHKLNELLGTEVSDLRGVLSETVKRLDMPFISGPPRALMLGTKQVSVEDLRGILQGVSEYPLALADQPQRIRQQEWIKALKLMIDPPPIEPRILSKGEVAGIFAEMHSYFGDIKILDEMSKPVVEALDSGQIVVDNQLRDHMRRVLIEAARINYSDELRETLDLVAALGMSFPVATPGFNGKIQMLGYSMGKQAWDEQKLRKFVAERMNSMGFMVQGREMDDLAQKIMRKNRVDTMRIGLGADVQKFDFSGGDPRQLWEMMGKPGHAELTHIDAELVKFSQMVKPREADEIVQSRLQALNVDLQEARKAGDEAKMSAIFDQMAQLDGRRYIPGEQPADTGGVADALPTSTERPDDWDAQIAAAEQEVVDAQTAMNDTRAQLAGLEDNPSATPRTGNEFARHPDTPDDMFSLGEVMAEGQRVMERANTMPKDEFRRVMAELQNMQAKVWQGEPQASKDAVMAAAAREGGEQAAESAEVTAAREAVSAAEAAHQEAQKKLTGLRNNGPNVAEEAPNPYTASMQPDPASEAADKALTFEDADAEYQRTVEEMNDPTMQGDLPEDQQARARTAARARKLAEIRNERAQDKAMELLDQRAQLAGETLDLRKRHGRAVTWDWQQVMTRGTPSQSYMRRGPTAPHGTKLGNFTVTSDITAMRDLGMVGGETAGMRTTAAGPFTRESLPYQAARLEATMEPALSARQMLMDAKLEAEAARAENIALLEKYAGRNLDDELSVLAQEKRALTAALAENPLEQEQERIKQELAQGVTDLERERIATDLQRDQVRAEIHQAEQSYNNALADVDDQLHDVRETILHLETRVPDQEAEIARLEGLVNYQAINTSDLSWHINEMKALNQQYQQIPKVYREDAARLHANWVAASQRAATNDPVLRAKSIREMQQIEDLLNNFSMTNDIDTVNALLKSAAEQVNKTAWAELGEATLKKSIKNFEDGATSVGPVMMKQLVDGWRPIAQHLLKDLPSGRAAVYMSEGLATAIQNMDAALRKPETFGLLDHYTRFFKTYATATPGFHVRNLMSGIFMNLVDGVRMRHMHRAPGIWHAFMKDPFNYMENAPPDIRRALMVTMASGVSGQFLEVAGGAGIDGLTKKSWNKIMNNSITRWNHKAGSAVEGSLRLSMALDSIAKGMIPEAALERITKFHFDYTEMSRLDRTARKFIPFWTFLSRNLPLQIESMWLRPRTYLQYQSFVRNFGETADPLTPQYWLDQGAFTMDQDAAGTDRPWYLAPDLPFTRVMEPINALMNKDLGKAFLSDLNPAIAAPVEAFGVGRKFYTGQDINEEYNAPSDAMKMLMPIFAMLGGTQTGGTSGQRLLDDRYAHVARTMLPMLNLAERLTDTEGNRAGRQGETVLRALGAPVYRLTPELREQTTRSAYFDRRDAAKQQAALARS